MFESMLGKSGNDSTWFKSTRISARDLSQKAKPERAYEQRPGIVLHETFDGTHPSMLGTYLAACVVYQSIYGRSIIGIDYDYFGEVDKESARYLQRIADETVREFYGQITPP